MDEDLTKVGTAGRGGVGEGEEILQGVSGGRACSHKGMEAQKRLLVGGFKGPGQRQCLLKQWRMLSPKVQVFLKGQICLDLIQPLTGNHARFLIRDCQARCWLKTGISGFVGRLAPQSPGLLSEGSRIRKGAGLRPWFR